MSGSGQLSLHAFLFIEKVFSFAAVLSRMWNSFLSVLGEGCLRKIPSLKLRCQASLIEESCNVHSYVLSTAGAVSMICKELSGKKSKLQKKFYVMQISVE